MAETKAKKRYIIAEGHFVTHLGVRCDPGDSLPSGVETSVIDDLVARGRIISAPKTTKAGDS